MEFVIRRRTAAEEEEEEEEREGRREEAVGKDQIVLPLWPWVGLTPPNYRGRRRVDRGSEEMSDAERLLYGGRDIQPSDNLG